MHYQHKVTSIVLLFKAHFGSFFTNKLHTSKVKLYINESERSQFNKASYLLYQRNGPDAIQFTLRANASKTLSVVAPRFYLHANHEILQLYTITHYTMIISLISDASQIMMRMINT